MQLHIVGLCQYCNHDIYGYALQDHWQTIWDFPALVSFKLIQKFDCLRLLTYVERKLPSSYDVPTVYTRIINQYFSQFYPRNKYRQAYLWLWRNKEKNSPNCIVLCMLVVGICFEHILLHVIMSMARTYVNMS